MKMPNGWGSITKLSGKRRKPWRVQKTAGWEWVSTTEKEWIDRKTKKVVLNPTAEQIALKQVKQRQKVIEHPTMEQMLAKEVKEHRIYVEIGCYATRQEAVMVLSRYNEDPYDLHLSTITLEEVYDKWSEQKYETISHSNVNGYKASWRLCEPIKKMKFVDVQIDHLQKIADDSGKNTPTLKKYKILMKALFEYAVIHGIITKDRNIVEYLDISKPGNPNAYDRKPFSKKDIAKIWKIVDSNEYYMLILMLIYTGLRIGEFLDLKKSEVNMEERWFKVLESKTDAGIRTVPIADKILPFFEYWMNKNDCEYLVSTPDGKHFVYRNYYDSYWKPLINAANITFAYTPHCTRHTCVSLLTAAKVDERFIQKIVGHKGQNVTQIVYTHLEIQELIDEINKI